MVALRINFHHLHYFWAVARDGNLTRCAKALGVSQSALSAQIKQLEGQLGEPLFVRSGRGLALTEAGRFALEYAQEIFSTGEELVMAFKQGRRAEHVLGVGAVATLSRNFQESFLDPLIGRPGVRLRIQSGSLDSLLECLANHSLDLVLSNRRPPRVAGRTWRCRRLARQQVSLVGHRRASFRFPVDLQGQAMILPGPESDVRTEFDALCEQLGIRVQIVAEVDDMATMRLLARDLDATALLPSIVVRDELQSGVLHDYGAVPGLFETFYCVTIARHFQHPLIPALVAREERDLLERRSRK